ncbi:4Fe-4S binding protein [Aromatoleum aromaticum]|uniref:Regulatory protein n=1 Tax=Aromatoleum aromaticum (strain DSM 19018 / LMG 30748 / EbN1) TaxID=76114 RepID=Q5P6C1_AROAE|nr:4Fe-4S binding protein [Aromatoleum aromaticum]NMG54910.1 4Fe-4S binding protein [Aromatoleum aromaticum]CAI07140.1 putative regulatory protein [Aromatoleum aromaticum EbN1]
MTSCSLPAMRPPRLARLGNLMRRHRSWIVGVQWAVLVAYVFLIVTPAFLPLPESGAHLWDNLTLFAQFVFWGIWWPFVLVSMMLMGRVWCGVLCPEGFVAEQVSRVGLGRPVPRWIKWGGWPFVAFLATTVYGQLVSVYEYPKAVLLVLGGSTVAAAAVGLVYGRGKRVWCRHLCPVSGVFGLLARLAPVHFRTDREAWQAHPAKRVIPVNCAPLVDIRRMESASACHMCGRCSGHRDAVQLAARLPGAEVASLRSDETDVWEARLLVFGVIGTAIGAFQWSASPWFVQAKLAAAEWLVERDAFALLDSDIPWWLLTHYPEANDVFTWLDGLMILGYIGTTALVIGGWITLWLRAAGWLVGEAGAHRRLAYALIPLGGVGVFLGLSALTVTLLSAEGVVLASLPLVRGLLLAVAAGASLVLGALQVQRTVSSGMRRAAALLAFCTAAAGAVAPWVTMFFIW